MFGTPVFWRETMKPAKFLIFDGRVVLVLVPAFMHLRYWTLITAIITMFVFWYFDRKGVSANSILRFLRSKLIGRKRSARGVHEERTAVDFGFECRVYLQRLEVERAQAEAAQNPKVGLLAKLGLAPKPYTSAPGGELTLEKESDQ
jgi:intracellular multiplication protein IcmT